MAGPVYFGLDGGAASPTGAESLMRLLISEISFTQR
jgi:hypothetical protein